MLALHVGEILSACQASLRKKAKLASPELIDNLHDVDLYLGVARKLLIVPPKMEVFRAQRLQRCRVLLRRLAMVKS